jgi:GT2 family glycosyltransferase
VDARLNVHVNATNAGYGAAANLAASKSSGDVLIFLNSDARLSPAAAGNLVREVDRYGGRCIAAARLIGPDGMVQRSAGLLPGPLDLAVRAWGLNRVAASVAGWPIVGHLVRGSRLAREYDSAPEATEPLDTSMVSGACCAMGRTAFEELDGFDERFFLYFEDADLCRRAAKVGIALRYVPAAVVPHIGGASSRDDYHFSPHHSRSMRQYLAKWYGPGGTVVALAILWIRALGKTIALRPDAGRAWRAWRAAAMDEDPRR